MRAKIPSSLEDHGRHQGAVSRLVARQRRDAHTPVANPDQAADMARLLTIEDAAREVVINAMCGEPVGAAIEALRVACGIECSPV